MAFLDRWEEEVSDFVKKYYQSFFIKNKFEFLKKVAGQGGGKIIYSDSGILLRITNEKSKFLVEIGQVSDGSFWKLDLIMALMKIIDYKIDEEDKSSRRKLLKNSFKWDDYSGNANSLFVNLNRIKGIFSSVNYANMKEQLTKLDLEKQTYV